MQTRDRDNNNNKQAAEEKRDLDLENIVGNLFIVEYQVDKLRTRLADSFYGYRTRMSNNLKASTRVFKHNNKWYKISLRIEEIDAIGKNKDGQDYMTGYSSKR
jgi:hypothetical protein